MPGIVFSPDRQTHLGTLAGTGLAWALTPGDPDRQTGLSRTAASERISECACRDLSSSPARPSSSPLS
jgi:hypothetical protein